MLSGRKPWIVGILNVTPDSFSDGNRHFEPRRAERRIAEMLEQGADLIDIGGESTRPGSQTVEANEEIRRIAPAVRAALVAGAVVSVDTRKPVVAQAACEIGAHVINDVGGLDDEMLDVAAAFGASGIAMHMQGTPATMQQAPRYEDVVEEVQGFLGDRVAAARRRGVPVAIDPGIGFGKRLEHNLALLAALGDLRALGAPVLLGVSRKSFLAELAPRAVDQRLAGSLAAALFAMRQGVDFLRVHDVAEHVDARAVHLALERRAPRGSGGVEASPARREVFVEGLRLECRIGVSDEERAQPQPVLCDVLLSEDLLLAEGAAADSGGAERDDLAATADYARAVDIVRGIAESGERRLLERLQRELEEALESAFAGWRARVALDKPSIAEELGAQRVGVRRIER